MENHPQNKYERDKLYRLYNKKKEDIVEEVLDVGYYAGINFTEDKVEWVIGSSTENTDSIKDIEKRIKLLNKYRNT